MALRKGLRRALLGCGVALTAGAFAPAGAEAHPCAGPRPWRPRAFLSLHTSGWAGMYPTAVSEHECAGEGGAVAAQFESVTSAADPVEDATSTHERSANITPIGYSARVVPTSGTGSGFINSDLAFQGKYAYQGTYNGFRVLDVSNPRDPRQVAQLHGLHHGPGRRRRLQEHARALVGLAGLRRRRRDPVLRRRARRRRASRASTSSTSPTPRRRRSSAACGWPRPATRPARRPAAARTPRPPCRTRRAATCTSTTAARAAPAPASRSSRSSSRTRRTPSRCAARTRSASATTTRS